MPLQDSVYHRVKKMKDHKCSLVCEPDTVTKHIQTGIWIPFRRFLRKSMMISQRDPRTKYYVKSTERLKQEESRHLERYYYMIHPFSDFHFFWQTIMTLVHSFILIIFPLHHFNKINTEIDVFNCIMLVLICFCLFNIILSFFMGYYDSRSDKVILQPRKVMMSYLTTHFVFDLFSSFNYNTFAIFTGLVKPIWFARYQWIIKLNRLFTMNDYLDNLQLRLKSQNYIQEILKCVLFFTITLFWVSFSKISLDYYFDRFIFNMESVEKFILEVDNSLRKLTLCDVYDGYYRFIHPIDLYTSVFIVQCSKFFEIWLIGKIFQITASYMMVTNRYQILLNQVKAYIRFKNLPKRMSLRIRGYLNFLYHHYVINEKAVMESLCPSLRNEILWRTCESLIKRVDTFKDLPVSAMMKLATKIKPEIFLPNDVVVSAGEVGHEMYFIHVGIVAVFTESGKEICHLFEGTHFGEITLVLDETRVASVVAIDYCELYKITKKDFLDVIEQYPNLEKEFVQASQKVLKKQTKFNLDFQ